MCLYFIAQTFFNVALSATGNKLLHYGFVNDNMKQKVYCPFAIMWHIQLQPGIL